ncbi:MULTISPECIES: MEMO1 family protein [Acidiplasma]|nr:MULTISPECIES: MEMO1 family protein [Acidiplasma]KJE48706.1 hypothetical protein TZ01_08755 [Acidiplasma sp. MBA-1]WMT55481.1 MAG: MEMO1 family protein [Acidiplasma sp.]
MNARRPYVAGAFYPDDRNELLKMLDLYMSQDFPQIKFKKIIGIIVPHAGYIYSGSTAAYAYNILRGIEKHDFIIIGPNHYGYPRHPSIYPDGFWETPLGDAKVDSDLSKVLIKKSGIIQEDREAHDIEHSIEVQIPFLQYIFDNNFEFAPIILGDQSMHTAKSIAETIYSLNRIPPVIISSDLNHYLSYDENNRNDDIIINDILKLNLTRYYDDINQYDITACGFGAIAVLMYITKRMGGKIRILHHSNSGDAFGDKRRVVGYGAFLSYIE